MIRDRIKDMIDHSKVKQKTVGLRVTNDDLAKGMSNEVGELKSADVANKTTRDNINKSKVSAAATGRKASDRCICVDSVTEMKGTPFVRTMDVIRDVFVLCVLSVFFTRKCKYLNILWASVFFALTVDGAAVKRSVTDVNSYLMKYGYLPSSGSLVGNLMLEEEFKTAIRKLQEFSGIPVTGEVDEQTKILLATPRCGRPDNEGGEVQSSRKKRYVIQGPKWDHFNLTWSLSLKNSPTKLNQARTRHVLRQALTVWEKNSKLTFREINSEQADIVVSFVRGYHNDNYPFDGPGSILAHAFFPGSGQGGDAHFDDEEPWIVDASSQQDEGTSLFAVAAHEFGHSLGLSHSSVKGALMYPWYQGKLHPSFQLPDDDRRGIERIYGAREVWSRIPEYHPPRYPITTTTTTTQAPTTTPTRRPHWSGHRHHHTSQPHSPYDPERRPSYPYNPDRRYTTERYTPRRNYPDVTRSPEIPRKSDIPRKKTTYDRPYRPVTTEKPDVPDMCDMSYDAVTMIRGELFIFKDKYHWRIGKDGLYRGYPTFTTYMWSGLPKNLNRIDAAYERTDGNVAFFIGNRIYLININNNQKLVDGYPKPLTSLNLPSELTHIDAAMVWGHNKQTYLFSGTKYWKLNEKTESVEYEYPRNISSIWKGVGNYIDSAFLWKDGNTYFFKGKGFWKFSDMGMNVEKARQSPSGPFWFGCPPSRRHPNDAPPPTESLVLTPNTATLNRTNKTLMIITILGLIKIYFNIT